MNNEEKRILFESLARIMSQNRGSSRCGGDEYTNRLISDCNSIARECEDDGK